MTIPRETKIPSILVWSRRCASNIDRETIATYGIPEQTLMQEAGTAVADVARNHGRKFLILAGQGKNGSDAIIAGCVLASDPTTQVTIVTMQTENLSCTSNNRNLTIINWTDEFDPTCLASVDFDCIIDGVTGLGMKGKLRPDSKAGKILDLGSRLQKAGHAKVIAVDFPSGLDCDDPFQAIATLPADLTVTFGGPKAVHVIAPARDLCGIVTVEPLSFSPQAVSKSLASSPSEFAVVKKDELLTDNPWNNLPKSAHKFDRGHILVIGGSTGKTGAPIMSGLASLRSGAGWATIALPGTDPTPTIPLELTVEQLWKKLRNRHVIDAKKLDRFVRERHVKSILIGPGTMESPIDQDVIAVLSEFSASGGFITIDAGATGQIIDQIKKQKPRFEATRCIMTPHPGEWKKLSKFAVPIPQNESSLKELQEICEQIGFHMLFKHATPILCGPRNFTIRDSTIGRTTSPVRDIAKTLETKTLVFNAGSTTLAKAGSGDVLAGVIAAHGSVACTVEFAAMRSLSLVAEAARIAGSKLGVHAVLATDIIHHLGLAERIQDP